VEYLVIYLIEFFAHQVDYRVRLSIGFKYLIGRGIFGNLSDRIFRTPGGLQGEVIDWIQIPNWPVFNVADMSVVSAAILITWLSWKNVPFRKGKGDL